MTDQLADIFSPEQEAKIAEHKRQWDAGFDAGMAGSAMPEAVSLMAFKAGSARRRAAAGEIVGFVCQGCRCRACGGQNWGYRLGCSCWPMDNPELFTKESGYSMEYGAQVLEGSDPDAPESKFMPYDRIVELVKAGREVIDIMRGEPVPIDLSPTLTPKEAP